MAEQDSPRSSHDYPPPTGPGWPTPFGPAAPTTQHAVTHATRPPRWRANLAYGVGATLLVGGSLLAGGAIGLQERGGGADLASGSTPSIVVEPPSGSGPTWGSRPQPTLPRDGGTGDSGGTGAVGSAVDASEEQSTGLVQISSTLANGTSAGTGIVLTSDGTIVTNHHVVEGARDIEVRVVTTGRTYEATYVGGSESADVAVIRLRGASGLTPAPLSDTPAAAGDDVTSVGDAGGDGGALTAAAGTVTATGEDITVQGETGGSNRLTGLLQLQAYVVPGDSGGAVLDADGRVVGMNVAASSNARDVTGYAIPLATVTGLVDRILAGDEGAGEGGDVALGYHGFLGVGLAAGSADDAPVLAGVDDGGAADDAGLAAGDTVTAVGGTRVATAGELQAAVAATEPGQRVRVTWTTSAGEQRAATVTMGTSPVP